MNIKAKYTGAPLPRKYTTGVIYTVCKLGEYYVLLNDSGNVSIFSASNFPNYFIIISIDRGGKLI